jgi:hypothetical protein
VEQEASDQEKEMLAEMVFHEAGGNQFMVFPD